MMNLYNKKKSPVKGLINKWGGMKKRGKKLRKDP
jgi:hypothetical protein